MSIFYFGAMEQLVIRTEYGAGLLCFDKETFKYSLDPFPCGNEQEVYGIDTVLYWIVNAIR
jgi:hypothetical protein